MLETAGGKRAKESTLVSLPRKTGEIVPKRGKRPSGAEGTGRAVVAYGRVSSGERGGRVVLPRALRAEGELSSR